MILSGLRILDEIASGRIAISPFDRRQLGPNSYDLRLDRRVRVYERAALDAREDNPTREYEIGEHGALFVPGTVYLASTVETTETRAPFVPILEGRSSVGRLGVQIHATAGFGDCGFCGSWTLEMTVTQPVRLYPDMRICQIAYFVATEPIETYKGKYQNQIGPVSSLMWKDE